MDAPPLTPADGERPLLVLDATWKLLPAVERAVSGAPVRRSIPRDVLTAYPRVGKTFPDPLGGLASVEALFIARAMLGDPDETLRWLSLERQISSAVAPSVSSVLRTLCLVWVFCGFGGGCHSTDRRSPSSHSDAGTSDRDLYERLDAALDASCEAISEVCDQQDNDCDGRIDEGFGLREPCVIGVGACERTGVWACGANGGAICDAPRVMPSAELCNAIDDDCDGVVDEGYPAVGMPCEGPEGNCRETGVYRCSSDGRSLTCVQPDTLAVERCNGADDDCDSLVDEGFGVGEICTVGVGQCARGSIGTCDSTGAARCPAVPGEPTSEMCDGLDNDCDGLVDEGYGGGPCLVGRGACTREGFFACQPDGDPVCMAEAGSPRYETCNGIDDDCDGLTDERWGSLGDACAAGAGACESRGVIECDGRPDYRLPFEGVRTDLMLRALEDDGYRICWRGGYGIAGEEIEGILTACDGDVLLMGCRRREAPIELSVAAVGYRAEVLAAVGPEPTASRIHNGVQCILMRIAAGALRPKGHV